MTATNAPALRMSDRTDAPTMLEGHPAEMKAEMLSPLWNARFCYPRARFLTEGSYLPLGMDPQAKAPPTTDGQAALVSMLQIGSGMHAQNMLRGSVLAMCRADIEVDGRKVGPLLLLLVETPQGETRMIHTAYRPRADAQGFEFVGDDIVRSGPALVMKK